MSGEALGRQLLDAILETFRAQKRLGERAMAQLDDAELHALAVPASRADTNSVAVIVRHMSGNMASRWTDFLTTDGEKASRERDEEFVDDAATRDEIMARWAHGWAAVFGAIEALTPADLERTVAIRGEPHTVCRAILRQVDHYGYHVGQLVLIAKVLKGPAWTTLSVPRGGTAAYNRSLGYEPGGA